MFCTAVYDRVRHYFKMNIRGCVPTPTPLMNWGVCLVAPHVFAPETVLSPAIGATSAWSKTHTSKPCPDEGVYSAKRSVAPNYWGSIGVRTDDAYAKLRPYRIIMTDKPVRYGPSNEPAERVATRVPSYALGDSLILIPTNRAAKSLNRDPHLDACRE